MSKCEIDSGPKALSLPTILRERLREALFTKGVDYQPRTRHLRSDGSPRYTNRLLLEASPYLQQHAHNPVDWHPWGDEAFALASQLKRPVLLSIGYATCHWCHVMEEESFEHEGIASYLNEHFIAIKVDREERPDIDSVYMACVQAWSGHGGWPMTVLLTPERKPFFGGTYFPPHAGARGARFGFIELLEDLKRVFDQEPERVELAAANVIEHIKERHDVQVTEATVSDEFMTEALTGAFKYYERLYDPQWGGLTGAPKFPSSLPIRFLLRYELRFGGEAANMARHTLRSIAAGGIHDQLGGGFHRYSVDEEWLVPHFEKMLYDNALLVVACIEVWQRFGDAEVAGIAASTLEYVRREMMREDGGFYAAQDADSPNPERHGEREEGVYFTWTIDEFKSVLGAELGVLAAEFYGVSAGGNFEGRSVLHRAQAVGELAASHGLSVAAADEKIGDAKKKLLAVRAKRQAPLTDDKVITAWQALMISAFAKAYGAYGSDDYLSVAERSMDFIRNKLWVDGRLVRCYKDGPSRTLGFLEDYAFVIQALIDLYEASFAPRWLEWALHLTDECERLFAASDGGYYQTSHDAESLLLRERPAYDGAVPAATSIHALNLLRLATLCDRPDLRGRALGVFAAAKPTLAKSPAMLSEMLLAMDFALSDVKQFIFTHGNSGLLSEFKLELMRRFIPHRVVAGADSKTIDQARKMIPLLRERQVEPGHVTAHMCQGQVCGLPVRDLENFKQQLS